LDSKISIQTTLELKMSRVELNQPEFNSTR